MGIPRDSGGARVTRDITKLTTYIILLTQKKFEGNPTFYDDLISILVMGGAPDGGQKVKT